MATQKPKLNPQQSHAQLDQYEQHLQGEMKKVKAVRTLYPPPPKPGEPQRRK